MKRILILYSEISSYTQECLNDFLSFYANVKVTLIRWPVNLEAPFNFSWHENISIINKSDVNLLAYLTDFNPNLILCSGWIDREYINLLSKTRKSYKKVLLVDNYWKNNIRQNLGLLYNRTMIKRHFDSCWVPSEFHKKYAIKLGFKKNEIKIGLYARNLNKYEVAYKNSIDLKSQKFPKNLIYVGRYLELKGIYDLLDAFNEFSSKNNDWNLHCVGVKDLGRDSVENPLIHHHGFKSTEEILKLIPKMGVFVMPSHYDHWCMAVNEFSAAGFPLLLSKNVGSSSTFLREGINGFSFSPKSKKSIIKALEDISALSDEELTKFAHESFKISKVFDTKTWSKTLHEFLNNE